MTGLQTVYDLFYRQGYYCQFCGAFRVKKTEIIKHIRGWHSEAVKEHLAKLTAEDQA